jgi:hypothetical protein
MESTPINNVLAVDLKKSAAHSAQMQDITTHNACIIQHFQGTACNMPSIE